MGGREKTKGAKCKKKHKTKRYGPVVNNLKRLGTCSEQLKKVRDLELLFER